jgi:hypothetical protein
MNDKNIEKLIIDYHTQVSLILDDLPNIKKDIYELQKTKYQPYNTALIILAICFVIVCLTFCLLAFFFISGLTT